MLTATIRRIPLSTSIPRSSHTLSVVRGRAYIFGGEIEPRNPVDNAMHVITLPSSGFDLADYTVILAEPESAPSAVSEGESVGDVPPPRVGHTACAIHEKIFIFGGRGGKEMTPLPEKGRVWVFSTRTHKWSHLDPEPGSAYPEPRSYHASTSDGVGTVFVHAGCPASGRLADLWAFDIASRRWSSLPESPAPARGGASLEYAQGRLWRFGGYDGKSELGGAIDYLELANINAGWRTVPMQSTGAVPGARSVAGLHAISARQGHKYLVSVLGERDPSAGGHEAAGKFWGDVWAYQLKPESSTGVAVDRIMSVLHGHTGEGTWMRLNVKEQEGVEAEDVARSPGQRGWIASSTMADVAPGSIVIWGGLNAKNEREGDGFILSIE